MKKSTQDTLSMNVNGGARTQKRIKNTGAPTIRRIRKRFALKKESSIPEILKRCANESVYISKVARPRLWRKFLPKTQIIIAIDAGKDAKHIARGGIIIQLKDRPKRAVLNLAYLSNGFRSGWTPVFAR